MRTLLVSTALAAIIAAAPATAQTWYGADDSAAAFPQDRNRIYDDAGAAFAQAPGTLVRPRAQGLINPRLNREGRPHSPNPATDVYDTSGNYVGSDPDIAVRNELSRDPPNRGD